MSNKRRKFRLRIIWDQASLWPAPAAGRPITSISCSVTLAFWRGVSRNHEYQMTLQTTPNELEMKKAARQPCLCSMATTIGGASAPPTAVAVQNTLSARARSETGTQCETADVQLGKCACFTGAEKKAHAEQHAKTSDRAGKSREGRPPEDNTGQNLARADAVAQNAARYLKERVRKREGANDPTPMTGGVICSSRCILAPATAMQRRSRYITNTSTKRNAKTRNR